MLRFVAFQSKMKLHIAIFTFLISVSASQECGNPAIPPKPYNGERIINGEEAIPHSFPWMVSIKVGTFKNILFII